VPPDDLAGAILDALAAPVALIGPDGSVRRTNDAWRLAGADPLWAATGVAWPPPAGVDVARELADAAGAVRDGRRERADLEVTRTTPAGRRWLRVRITRLALADGTGLVVAADDVTARHERESDLIHRARHDPLTGLPNRTLLLTRLADALVALPAGGPAPGAHAAAVLFLDLDEFRRVNTTYGYGVGDALLRAVGRRMTATLRPGDLLARWGGDEFVALVTGTTSPDAMSLAESLVAGFTTAPVRVGERDLWVSLSVGMALSGGAASGGPRPADHAAAETLAGDLVNQASDALLRERGQHGQRGQGRRGPTRRPDRPAAT
jgi:diguanylate cyclase (GGDEF)-like protein